MRLALMAVAVTVSAASSAPSSSTGSSQPEGRSCDRQPLPVPDTSFNAVDPLAATLIPSGDRGPRYPRDMREDGISGEVVVSFVVDTTGRVPSGGAWIHRETRSSFGDAVCSYLKSARFVPLVVSGRRLSVRVLSAPYSFEVR